MQTPIGPKGVGSDSARSTRLSIFARLLRRPELGALSGAILVYIIFYFLAGSSGMFTLRGMIEILQVSAEIGILATTASLLMIAGEFDLSMGSMIGFAGVIIGLGSTVYHLPLYLSILAGVGHLRRNRCAQWLVDGADRRSFVHRHAGFHADLAR